MISTGATSYTTLTVAFYQHDDGDVDTRRKDHPPGEDGWLTSAKRALERLQSRITGWWVRRGSYQFVHVELMFSNGTVVSSTEATGVHYDADRVLSHDNYTGFLSVRVSEAHQALMQEFVMKVVGRPFNRHGRTWNSIGPLRQCFGVIDTEGQSYYCSELITTLLKIAGLCEPLDPRCTDPTQLFLYLLESGEGVPSYNKKEAELMGYNDQPVGQWVQRFLYY